MYLRMKKVNYRAYKEGKLCIIVSRVCFISKIYINIGIPYYTILYTKATQHNNVKDTAIKQ